MKDKWTDFSHSGTLSSLVGTDRPRLYDHMELHVHIGTVSDSQVQNALLHKLHTYSQNEQHKTQHWFSINLSFRQSWRWCVAISYPSHTFGPPSLLDTCTFHLGGHTHHHSHIHIYADNQHQRNLEHILLKKQKGKRKRYSFTIMLIFMNVILKHIK